MCFTLNRGLSTNSGLSFTIEGSNVEGVPVYSALFASCRQINIFLLFAKKGKLKRIELVFRPGFNSLQRGVVMGSKQSLAFSI